MKKLVFPTEDFLTKYEQHQKTEATLMPSFTFETSATYFRKYRCST